MSVTFASIALALIAQAGPSTPPPAPPAPLSVYGSIGGGKTWDDEGSIGSGLSAGGGVEWRFRPKWSVGADVERVGHERDTPGLEWSGHTVFASANVAYHFAATGVSPFVGGGFGGAFHDGEVIDRLMQPGSPAPVRTFSSSSTMGYGMAGVDIPIGTRLVVSPDFRWTFCQAPDGSAPWSVIRFGVKGSVALQAGMRTIMLVLLALAISASASSQDGSASPSGGSRREGLAIFSVWPRPRSKGEGRGSCPPSDSARPWDPGRVDLDAGRVFGASNNIGHPELHAAQIGSGARGGRARTAPAIGWPGCSTSTSPGSMDGAR